MHRSRKVHKAWGSNSESGVPLTEKAKFKRENVCPEGLVIMSREEKLMWWKEGRLTRCLSTTKQKLLELPLSKIEELRVG